MGNSREKPQSVAYPSFADDRGIFAPCIDEIERYAPAAGPIRRVYSVYNYSHGTVRGFHYHEKEWKFFTVVAGAAKFVAVDPDKPGEPHVFIGSPRNRALIIVPPHYANGWMSLEDGTILLCASNLTTKESLADDKRFDPYVWGDVWSVHNR